VRLDSANRTNDSRATIDSSPVSSIAALAMGVEFFGTPEMGLAAEFSKPLLFGLAAR
jgi:hypothetical protein